MAKKRGIVITSFGRRDIDGLLRNLAHMAPGLPVKVLHENNVPPFWQGHSRWGQRNSDLHKATAVLHTEFESVLVLDDDMRIVNSEFIQGFNIAERFGFCLPLNPRIYAGIDCAFGTDVPLNVKQEMGKFPFLFTACNMGTIFADRTISDTKSLFVEYGSGMKAEPCRGPVAMWRALWTTAITPYFLPVEWCVCAADAHLKTCRHGTVSIPPIILHVGHKEVWDWYMREPIFEEVRNVELQNVDKGIRA